ncbi:hypothetical protein [Bacillus sp. AFS040349]|nr:hypothetical protein [Bacillus sp. AFS040349]
MKNEKMKQLENNFVGIIIAFILAYIIGSFIFGYELTDGFIGGFFHN